MLKKSFSALSLPSIKLPKRFEGTIVERWANYWRGLARDYKDVGLESIKTMKSNPRKSAVYGSLGAFLCGCVLNNPDKDNFINQLLVTENFVGMVPETSQNPQAIKYLKYLNENLNKNTLRITSLGLFSVMWISDYSSNQATSDATCDYLSPEVSTFISTRVIDIGWWNNWWNLEKLTQDYDVNF